MTPPPPGRGRNYFPTFLIPYTQPFLVWTFLFTTSAALSPKIRPFHPFDPPVCGFGVVRASSDLKCYSCVVFIRSVIK